MLNKKGIYTRMFSKGEVIDGEAILTAKMHVILGMMTFCHTFHR
jgi:hypothetical protein